MNTIGGLEGLEGVAKGTEAALDKIGPIGSFIANGVGLFSTPWRCYKEKRWPTRDEWIKLGLCALAITLIAVSMAIPAVAVGFFIAAAAIGLVKSVQNIRIKRSEVHHFEQLSHLKQAQIKQLVGEIHAFEQMLYPTEEQIKEFKVKNETLIKLTDQYVQLGHHIRGLKENLHHPFKSLLNQINVAMSGVALIGVVVTIFFPPAGLGLILGAGLGSLLTMVVSAASQWFANRHEKRLLGLAARDSKAQHSGHPPMDTAPEDHTAASALNHIVEPLSGAASSSESESIHPSPVPHSVEVDNQLSSTALELLELKKSHPVNAVVRGPVPKPSEVPPSPKHCEDVEKILKSELHAFVHSAEKIKIDEVESGDESEGSDERGGSDDSGGMKHP